MRPAENAVVNNVQGALEKESSTPIKITVSVLSHNAENRIRDCLDAILNQTRSPDEVLLIDNYSSDRTLDVVREHYPNVNIRQTDANTGCSGGRNRQMAWATNPFVMIVDDDCILGTGCLKELENAVRELPEAAIWSPRICYDQDKALIQSDGCNVHFIGETVLINPERRINGARHNCSGVSIVRQVVPKNAAAMKPLPTEPFQTVFQGGVGFLVRKDIVEVTGGYDETFFFGRTDSEFSYRVTLSGHNIFNVPKAVVYHRMKERGLSQVERQIRNRWSMILQTYSLRTILILLPAFVVYEACVAAFLMTKGNLRKYFAGIMDVIRSLPYNLRRRREVQKLKVRRDRDLLTGGFINMRADLARNKLVRLGHGGMNHFFNLYWKCCRRFAG